MRPATPLICAFGDKHKHTYGVTPICRALAVHGVQIASRTYFRGSRGSALRTRTVGHHNHRNSWPATTNPDAEGKRPPECLYGSLKMWAHLQRQGFRWPSATVKTIMRANGWRGVPLAAHITHHRTRPGRGPGPRPGGSAMAGFSNEPAGSGRLHLRADDVEFRLHRVRGRRLRRCDRGLGMLADQRRSVRRTRITPRPSRLT
ncbi:conserved hypothetical protein [Mycobacterium tuberculosis T85]|nr:conserved hypothetical protein [Mycobacterium tuberculosis T85]